MNVTEISDYIAKSIDKKQDEILGVFIPISFKSKLEQKIMKKFNIDSTQARSLVGIGEGFSMKRKGVVHNKLFLK